LPFNPHSTIRNSISPCGFRYVFRFLKIDLRCHRCRNELGDTVAALDDKRFIAQVHENHLDLAAVIGVDGAGSVEYGNAILDGESAARPDLDFIAWRYLENKTRGNKRASERRNHDLGFDRRDHVTAARMLAHALRKIKPLSVRETFYEYGRHGNSFPLTGVS
jgi:hypothetical protein